MLMKKIDRSRLFLQDHQELFACPHCHEALKIADNSFICQNNHQFDLNKKGNLHFLNHTVKTEYDKEMLGHRQKMIQEGLYQPLIDWLMGYFSVEDITSIVDMGCGEGSFLQQLDQQGLPGTKIGFDISKDGVALATNQDMSGFWCVADITNLPFADNSMSHLLNIFSPSHYQEFRRVLKPGGKLIKIVPESGYLKELREIFYDDQEEKQNYSNHKVVEKFEDEMTALITKRLTYQIPVTDDNYRDILMMSPIKWGASPEVLAKNLEKRQFNHLTIDILILIGQ